jgi:hypothetical protein
MFSDHEIPGTNWKEEKKDTEKKKKKSLFSRKNSVESSGSDKDLSLITHSTDKRVEHKKQINSQANEG